MCIRDRLIQSTLTVTTADLKIGYDLATSMEVSQDGLTWTVNIRDDVNSVSYTHLAVLSLSDTARSAGIRPESWKKPESRMKTQ